MNIASLQSHMKKHIMYIIIFLSLLLTVSFCYGAYSYFHHPIQTIQVAVSYRSRSEVQRLIREHADIQGSRDEIGDTPFLMAVGSDQFVIAEMLLDAGADIFAHDMFGLTAGRSLQNNANDWSPDSEEGRAQARVIQKMKDKGFPFPAPTPEEILTLEKIDKWPPRGTGTSSKVPEFNSPTGPVTPLFTFKGTYHAEYGVGELHVSVEDPTHLRISGQTILAGPNNSLDDQTVQNKAGKISGIILMNGNEGVLLADPRDPTCKLNFKFSNEMLEINGGYSSCDATLGNFDGKYYIQS